MEDLIGSSAAIYVWRRNLLPPPHVVQNAHQLNAWLTECLAKPYADLPAISLAHFLYLRGIVLGGGSLSEVKAATLKLSLQEMRNRHWLRAFLGSLNDLAPPLYVGEADNLARRVRDHLRGDTDFASILREKIKLSWDTLTLLYCPLPAQFASDSAGAKDRRTLLEMIAARLLLAGCTTRPG